MSDVRLENPALVFSFQLPAFIFQMQYFRFQMSDDWFGCRFLSRQSSIRKEDPVAARPIADVVRYEIIDIIEKLVGCFFHHCPMDRFFKFKIFELESVNHFNLLYLVECLG